MKKLVVVLLVMMALLLGTIGTALAITDGELDNEGHPYVGMYYFSDPDGNWRCSGTLISPTVFLTAGHCTYQAFNARVSFDSEITDGSTWVTGVAYAYPNYTNSTWWMNDVGVVVLDEPVVMAEYGALPEEDQLDTLKTRRGKQDTTFTAVGYGLQRINPVFVEADKVRMVANPRLIQINTPGFTGDFSLLLSNNHSTGGTCFGDSGGPNFLGDSTVVAGITSFGMNGNCAGTGGVFRMDRQDVLSWAGACLADGTSCPADIP